MTALHGEAIVTGAGRGLGREIALALAGAGMAVAAVLLISDAAGFITGTVLPVDGGFLTGRTLVRSGSV